MQRNEKDSVRREALKEIVAEITTNVAVSANKSEISAQVPANNVFPLSNHTRAVNSDKKH